MSSIPARDIRVSNGRARGDGNGAAADVADVLDRLRRIALIAAGAGLGLLLLGLLIHEAPAFFQAYLYAYVFWTGLALGCFALLMLQHLVGGAWGAVIQRPLEAGTRLLPLMALLFVPLALMVAFRGHYLYEWLEQPWRDARANMHFKLWYLSRGAFLVRALIYFVLWIGLASILNRWSARQDATADPLISRRLQLLSGPGLAIYVITVSLAIVDWVMSLTPDWYSTLFGLLFVVGQVLSTLAVMVSVLALLAGRRPFHGVVAMGHFHDLGNLLLAFVMLWAYLSFSQFLIIWSGNIAEETPYYYARTQTGWRYAALLLVMFHFFVPFVLLLWRRTKRSIRPLTMVAAALLVMRLIDLFWVIGPSLPRDGGHGHGNDRGTYAAADAAARGTTATTQAAEGAATAPATAEATSSHGPQGAHAEGHGGWWHVWMFPAAAAGLGGVWVLAFVSQLRRRPLLPLNDPRLAAGVAGAHDHD